MAESDLPVEFQIAVIPDEKCQLCQVNNILFKCLNCDELICEQCKIIHLRSKISKNHKVVCLKSTEVRHSSGSEATNKKCRDHSTEDLLMYCNSCHVPICRECIITGLHSNHPMVKIEDIIDSKQTELSQIIRQSKERSNQYEVIMKTASKNRKDFSTSISQKIEDVKARNNEIKSKIDKITSDLIKQLKSLDENNQKAMTQLEQGLQGELDGLKLLIQQCEDKQRVSNIELVKFVTDIKQQLDKYRPDDPSDVECPPDLITRNVDEEELKGLFGDLGMKKTSKANQPLPQNRNIPTTISPTIDVKIINTFTNNCNYVAAVSSDQAWLWSCGCTGLSLVSSRGDVIQNINTDFIVYDAAVTKSGDLLLSVFQGNKVKKLTTDETCTDIYTAEAGYNTRGITFTDTGSIIVVLYKDNNSKLVEMTISGLNIRTIQHDTKDKTTLFNLPRFVCTNINGDIIVADYFKVVVVDKSGQRRFIYDGKERGLKASFDPMNVVTDRYGHIFISDNSNSVVHTIDQDGMFLKYLLTKEHGCNQPRGLSIDTSGRLWVGNGEHNQVIIVKYV